MPLSNEVSATPTGISSGSPSSLMQLLVTVASGEQTASVEPGVAVVLGEKNVQLTPLQDTPERWWPSFPGDNTFLVNLSAAAAADREFVAWLALVGEEAVAPSAAVLSNAQGGDGTLSFDVALPGEDETAMEVYHDEASPATTLRETVVPAASHIITGLTNGVERFVRVKLRDAAGNVSAYSNEVSATPTPAGDQPVVSQPFLWPASTLGETWAEKSPPTPAEIPPTAPDGAFWSSNADL